MSKPPINNLLVKYKQNLAKHEQALVEEEEERQKIAEARANKERLDREFVPMVLAEAAYRRAEEELDRQMALLGFAPSRNRHDVVRCLECGRGGHKGVLAMKTHRWHCDFKGSEVDADSSPPI